MKNERVAVPVFQERISPLLDVAKKFAIYEITDGEIKQKFIVDVLAESEPFRVEKLKDLGVTVIIGGAVSCFVSRLIIDKGMRLIPWLNGPVDDVIECYANDALESFRAEEPACRRGNRRGRCAGRGRGGKERDYNNGGEE